jgi:hypothetical protein
MPWNLLATNPPPVGENKLFLGWAEGEDPAVFHSYSYSSKSGPVIGYSIHHDSEGLSNYEPTHWLPLPTLPE